MNNQTSNPMKWVFVMILVMGGLFVWGRRGGSDSVAWRTDLKKASDEARQQGKPMVLYFTADWCPPCRQMKSSTWKDAGVAKALDSYVPVKIDVDQHPEMARKFNVTGIPRVQIMNADGEIGPGRVGYVSADEMVDWLGK